jgi:hypothetical protein
MTMKTEPFLSIDAADLATATGGWNPLKGLKDKVKDKFNDAKQQAHDLYNKGRDLGGKVVHQIEDRIRRGDLIM